MIDDLFVFVWGCLVGMVLMRVAVGLDRSRHEIKLHVKRVAYLVIDEARKTNRKASGDELIEQLVASAKALGPMTDEERRAQRRSFAYGNLKIDRPELTQEEFDRIADEMDKPVLTSRSTVDARKHDL